MKLILGTLAVALFGVVLLVYVAKPDIPKVSGIPDYDAGASCLREVPRSYNADFFSYKAWVKYWYAHNADKWGIKMSPSLLDSYKRYIDLQLDVECYILSSNDSGLNMALSSIEFEAIYNLIAEDHGFEKLR